MKNRIEQRSDLIFVWKDEFAQKSAITKGELVEVGSKRVGEKVPRNIAGKQLAYTISKISVVIAYPSISD